MLHVLPLESLFQGLEVSALHGGFRVCDLHHVVDIVEFDAVKHVEEL